MVPKFATVVFILGIGLLVACQSAKELHYFKAGQNYYRLKINERSFASKSRYLSGYFDEKAVDKYFSEMSQPDSGKFIEWVSGGPRGSELVMILSTNSNTIAEQIGGLANNEALLENIALLANKDKIAQGRASGDKLAELKKASNNLIAAGDAFIGNASAGNINQGTLDFLQHLQLQLQGKMVLKNLDSALAKYKTP